MRKELRLDSGALSYLADVLWHGYNIPPPEDFWQVNDEIREKQKPLYTVLERFHKFPPTYEERVMLALGAYYGFKSIPKSERDDELGMDEVINGLKQVKGWRWEASHVINEKGERRLIPINEFDFPGAINRTRPYSDSFSYFLGSVGDGVKDPGMRQAFESGVLLVVVSVIARTSVGATVMLVSLPCTQAIEGPVAVHAFRLPRSRHVARVSIL